MKRLKQIPLLFFTFGIACSLSLQARAENKNSGDIVRAEYSSRAGTIEDALANAKEVCKNGVPYKAQLMESKQIKKEICKGGEDYNTCTTETSQTFKEERKQFIGDYVITVNCVWKKPSISELKKADAPSVAFCKDLLIKFHDNALVAKQNYEAACLGNHVAFSHMYGCWLSNGKVKSGLAGDGGYYRVVDVNKTYQAALALLTKEKIHFDKDCNLYPDEDVNKWTPAFQGGLQDLQSTDAFYQEQTPKSDPSRAVAQDSKSTKKSRSAASAPAPAKGADHSAK